MHCVGACLVASTESQYFYLEKFEWGCWKLHCKFFESVLSTLWLLGCCIMFHMHWILIFLNDFSLLLFGWNFCNSHTSPWCIYYLWNIWMGILLSGMNIYSPVNSMTPAIISFVLSWLMVDFSSKRVSWFIPLYHYSVSYS